MSDIIENILIWAGVILASIVGFFLIIFYMFCELIVTTFALIINNIQTVAIATFLFTLVYIAFLEYIVV
jgi:hypothetical protein